MNAARVSCAARHARQARLPAPGQLGRGQALHRQRVDEPDAHVRRHEVLPVARDEGPPDQRLDGRGARGGRAQARVVHGGAQLLVGDVASRRLHRAQQRRLGVAGRRARLLGHDLELAVQALPLRERRQRGAASPSPSPRALVAVGRSAELGDLLPARDEPHPTARAVAIGRRRQRRHERLVARRFDGVVAPRLGGGARRGLRRAHADDDVGERELRVGVERAEEAPRHQVEDAPLVAGQLVEAHGLAGRDDGVVVARPCRRRTRGARARAGSRAAAPRTARTRAARPAPRTAWAAPCAMSLVRWRESVRG